jgi:tetratricopeptide (TPR) repeat protein
MRDLEQFRNRVRNYYRRQYNSDGRRYTQRDLASVIGLHEDELGKRLHSYHDSKTKRRWDLSGEDVLAIVRTLAKWGAITGEQARELLDLMDYSMDNSDWKAEFQQYFSIPLPPGPLQGLPTSDTDKQQEERLARLRALQTDHSGLIRNYLVSFVGRQTELEELRQHINSMLSTGGYITIIGQAGQGKSSVIAKLIEEFDPKKTVYHFIPFNAGPDYQVNLLRDLMASLILEHGLSHLYVASESRPVLRDYFSKVLVEIVAKGKQVVIFIDGLDQLKADADGERDLSFLPNDLPKGVVAVLGTRPDDTLRPLELRKSHVKYNLPHISEQDFDLILAHRRVKLSRLQVDQFYFAMQKNALYLDLVARELAQEGAASPEEVIKRVADNPENIFSLSIDRLKRHQLEWREVLKPLLGVLLAAQEPLAELQSRRILDLDDERLRSGITRLGGLIADDGWHRYSLFHLKFYDYLRQDEHRPDKEYVFAIDEVEQWHNRLARWCEPGHSSIIWRDTGELSEQGRREYARRHYITHLYHARAWQRLYEVLDEQQYGQMKIQADPSMRSYSQDLDLGRQAAARQGETIREGMESLAYLWRYTLLRCSLASRADGYPDEAFRLLLLLGRKSLAVELAELVTIPGRKVSILIQLAEQLAEQEGQGTEHLELLTRATVVAHTIEDSHSQANAFSELGVALFQAQQWEQAEALWSEAKEVIDQWNDHFWRSVMLKFLGLAFARIQQWERAKSVIDTITDSDKRVEALGNLGRDLAQAQQWERARSVWAEAEKVISTIEKNYERANALSILGAALAQAQQWKQAEGLCTEAREIIDMMQDGYTREQPLRELESALRCLATAFAQGQRWERAESVIDAITDSGERAKALSSLGAALIQAQEWERAERIINTIKDSEKRDADLQTLVVAFTSIQHWERAKEMIDTITDSDVLSKLGVELTQVQQWKQAEVVWTKIEKEVRARKIHESYERDNALQALVTAFTEAQQWESAEGVISMIEDNKSRTKALSKLGIALTQAQQWERTAVLWAEIEEMILNMEDRSERTKALAELGVTLVGAQQWERAEGIIRTIDDSGTHLDAIAQLAMALTRAQQWERAEALWAEAEDIIQTLRDGYRRVGALRGLGAVLAQAQQWERAERIVSMIEDSFWRDRPLAELGVALAKAQQRERAERVTRMITDSYWRSWSLQNLGAAFAQVQQRERAEALWAEAEELAHTVEGERQSYALQDLGAVLAQAQQWERAKILWAEAEAVVHTVERDLGRVRALQDLGAVLAQAQQWERAKILWAEAEELIHTIDDIWRRDGELKDLAKALAEAQQWEQAERVTGMITDNRRGEVLQTIAAALAEAQQWEQAERVICKIEDNSQRYLATDYLAEALAKVQQWEQAEKVIYVIQPRFARPRALNALAKKLIKLGEYKHLLSLIHHAWLQADTRKNAIELLSLAAGFIPLKPELGTTFCDAFSWVNDFLRG